MSATSPRLDPAPPAFMKQPVGAAIPTKRLLPEETRRPGVFFAEFFRPLGLEECLGGTLAAANGRFAMIGLHRGPDRAAFDDDDIAKLERLMPHLSRALQLRRVFVALDRRNSALAEACDRLAAGMVGLDEAGRTLFANDAARRMSARDDGLALDRSGRPLCGRPRRQSALWPSCSAMSPRAARAASFASPGRRASPLMW